MEKSPRQSDPSREPQEGGVLERTQTHEEDAPFEYRLLKGHFEPDGKTWKSDEELRMDYLQLTDGLIQKMTEGTKSVNPETREQETRIPSVVVFLDKSARPLSHLVRDMWPVFAKDPETGEIPPMPSFKFLNVDREQWVNKIDPQGTGIMDVNHIDPSIIRSLRSIFLTPSGKERVRTFGLTESADTAETILDDENILLVDETYATGRTAKIASDLMKRAFPTSHIDTAHWMHHTESRKGARYNIVPVWYKEDSVWGRGVNNRYADFAKNQSTEELAPEDYYRRMGRWFLSAPHWFTIPDRAKAHDERYYQLLREFKELATNPDVPLMPALTRHDAEDRVVTYNMPEMDISRLADDEKDDIIDDVIARKRAINEEAAKKSRG